MTDKLATQTKGTLAVVPEHLKKYVGAEDAEANVTNDDILIPRLAVAQAGMSPQLKKNNELFIPELEEGELFNTVTNENYGTKATVIPLFFTKNYVQFEGGSSLKVLNVYKTLADVPEGGLTWGVDDEGKRVPPPVTEFKNRMCLILTGAGTWQPIAVSFKKGEAKFSDQWNSHIKFARLADRLPCFAHTYTVSPKLKTQGQQSWYVKTVAPAGHTPDNIIAGADAYFTQLSKVGYTVDNSGIEPDEAVDGDTSFDN